MILAYERIYPPDDFYHDPKIKNSNGQSVAYFLKEAGLKVAS